MATSAVRVIATTVLAIVMSGHAVAKPPPAGVMPSITVRFGDLNTASPEGITALYARVRFAADEVCTKEVTWYPPAHWAQKNCYRETLANVVARLNLPRLTALHRATMAQSRLEPERAFNR